jgi:hypothetical protein
MRMRGGVAISCLCLLRSFYETAERPDSLSETKALTAKIAKNCREGR